MGPEDPPVGMDFINDHISQVLEEPDPFGMMGEDPGMEHVRIGNHDMAAEPDRGSGISRRVPVIGKGGDRGVQRLDQGIQLMELVLGQGLGRKEIEGTGLGFTEHG